MHTYIRQALPQRLRWRCVRTAAAGQRRTAEVAGGPLHARAGTALHPLSPSAVGCEREPCARAFPAARPLCRGAQRATMRRTSPPARARGEGRGRTAMLLLCCVLGLSGSVLLRGSCGDVVLTARRMLAAAAAARVPDSSLGPEARGEGSLQAPAGGGGTVAASASPQKDTGSQVLSVVSSPHERCSLLFTVRLAPSDAGAHELFAAGAATFPRQKMPGGSCGDDPATWVELARSDEWWAAHPHGWADARCPAALSEEPPAEVSLAAGARPGTSTALPLVPGPLLRAMHALRSEADRRGCVFLSFTTLQEPAVAVHATHSRVVAGAAWAQRSKDGASLHAWAHNHPELLLVERLWRAHLPSGDGPGSDEELTPRGAWAERLRAGGLPAPPPPAGKAEAPLAEAGNSNSLLAQGMQKELEDFEEAKHAAGLAQLLPPDWRCEKDGDMDMLRVCGHMDDVYPQLLSMSQALNLRRVEAGKVERFEATCSLQACGELAPAVTAGLGSSAAPLDASCCSLQRDRVQLLQDGFAASRGAYVRYKRGAHGCDKLQRNASGALAAFDVVAPESRLEEAVLLASLALGTPETRAPELLAAAAVASNLAGMEAAAAALRESLPEGDYRALVSFNICSNLVYEDVQARFSQMMAIVSGEFGDLLADARARRTKAEQNLAARAQSRANRA